MKLIKKSYAALPPDMIEEYFNEVSKCKTSGIVQNVKKVEEDLYPNFDKPCLYDIIINLKGFLKSDIKSNMPTGNCITDSPYYIFEDLYQPLPKKGEEVYAIIDKSNSLILKYGEKNYNEHLEIPNCEKESMGEYYFYLVGIVCFFIIILIIYFKFYRK